MEGEGLPDLGKSVSPGDKDAEHIWSTGSPWTQWCGGQKGEFQGVARRGDFLRLVGLECQAEEFELPSIGSP